MTDQTSSPTLGHRVPPPVVSGSPQEIADGVYSRVRKPEVGQ